MILCWSMWITIYLFLYSLLPIALIHPLMILLSENNIFLWNLTRSKTKIPKKRRLEAILLTAQYFKRTIFLSIFTGKSVTVGVSMYVLSISRLSEVDMVMQPTKNYPYIIIFLHLTTITQLLKGPFTTIFFVYLEKSWASFTNLFWESSSISF